jgi:hypothetical protein
VEASCFLAAILAKIVSFAIVAFIAGKIAFAKAEAGMFFQSATHVGTVASSVAANAIHAVAALAHSAGGAFITVRAERQTDSVAVTIGVAIGIFVAGIIIGHAALGHILGIFFFFVFVAIFGLIIVASRKCKTR